MIFFLEILRRNPLSPFKILAQNNSPANYCARNSSLILNHTYIGSKDAGHCPATQLLSLFSRQSDSNSNYARNSSQGSPLYQIRGQNRHRNRRTLCMYVHVCIKCVCHVKDKVKRTKRIICTRTCTFM